jgi:sterol 3beta-glucosyltransferase
VRVLIAAVGSRGDVAPMTGLGTRLRGAGHDVSVASYGMFEGLITACGLGFRLMPGDPEAIGASQQGQRWQEGGTGAESGIRFVRLIADNLREVNAALLQAAQQDTDMLLLAGMTWFGGYRIAQWLGLPSIGLALQPTHPTSQFLPSGITTRSLGGWGNRVAGRAAAIAGASALDKPSKRLWAREGLSGLSVRQLYRRQEATRWPFLYGYSPSAVPRPTDWRAGIEVAGYWWPEHPAGWAAPDELGRFLAAGPPPVYIGFGSRNPADAAKLTAMVSAARRQAGVRLVIQAGWASLGTGLAADDDVIVIGEAPHDWLFPQMSAVVHHAGAGTTAAGLRAGMPTVSVPVITDQPFWASRVTALGAGPAAVPYKSLTAESLAAAISDAVSRDSYRSRAQEIAKQLAGEDGTRAVIQAVDRLAGA